ncbi:retrovirus-related pol polyprotein from transposon TNT 1-94 [Tanacetum coccineum]|uniref:Retrovirus-related pol polyprotein from transposon TNT 1-94 n=1 Tax=Tanacetum coccineum TaxID=301880 RepID=A0ABQ4WDN0_9ASTR
MENLNEVKVKELRNDNETEFKNHKLEEFYDEKGISHNFSSPCTLEQNGVAERRKITLIEAARTMLNSAKLPKQFWGEAINTACYTQNRSIIVKRHGKTAYDVFRGRHEIAHHEEQSDSDVESELDDNTTPYHQLELERRAKVVPTEVSTGSSANISMVTILDEMRDTLDEKTQGTIQDLRS